MSCIFLREVHLRDFRTFGQFTLDLPAGPGLTLLVGTNGLGKSSFFDGIEWCLTGSIRRFQDYIGRLKEADYLTRRDAAPDSHEVTLAFTEGDTVRRTASDHPGAEALIGLLKNPDWDIQDLGAYLGFTHFLGQASQQRFTSRGQGDQWQALKGPSGIDRLEAIRTALRGRATTLAFGRRSDREGIQVQLAEQSLSQWRADSERLVELRARSAAAGGESQARLDARLAALETVLPSEEAVPGGYLDRLARIRSAIDAAQRAAAQDRAGLEPLRAILANFSGASAQAGSIAERAVSVRAAITEATSAFTAAALASTEAERAASAQAELVSRVEAEQAEAGRIRSAIAEYELQEAERRSAEAAEQELVTKRQLRLEELAEGRTALEAALAARAALAALEDEQAALQRWSERVATLIGQEQIARSRRTAAAAAVAAADRARTALPELEQKARDSLEASEGAELRLAARRRDASELSELLSGLAAHIGHEDTDCPVCATPFPPGELQDRARTALALQDALLAAEVRNFEDIRAHAATAARVLARARSDVEASATAAAEADQAEAAASLERHVIAEGLGVDPASNLGELVDAMLAEVARQRASRMQATDGPPQDVASAQARVAASEAATASLHDRIGTAVQRRSRSESALRAIEESLASLPKPWTMEAADIALQTKNQVLVDVRKQLADLNAAWAAAATAEASARQRFGAVEGERDLIENAAAEAERVRVESTLAWQKLGMSGEPIPEAITAREQQLNQFGAALAGQLEEAAALATAYEASLAHDQLRVLITAMDKQGGAGAADNTAAHEQTLLARLTTAREALRLTGATRDAVVAYGEQLKAEAESFSTRFLLPLNDLIDSFNRALLSTPGETVQFNAAHTVERTALGMQLRYADPIENARYRTQLPPQLVLSEGQMAANGFSILCAASRAYRWSRWRALLLDDPLQHNDIIHAAAFVDVMRNMVELQGYQLIMSTHNLDEGEFISRKFDAAGLPCTVVELVGASKEGVLVSAPRYNAAARILLAEPTAAVA
jgi:DNA repair exonuclease SbcCD ATPase subunit